MLPARALAGTLALLALACSDDPPTAPAPDAAPALLDGGALDADAAPGGPDGQVIDDLDATAADAADAGTTTTTGTFTLSGRVTYDHAPAADEREGGPRIDYGRIAARPARRVQVHAVDGTTVLASAETDDDGAFTLEVPQGRVVRVRADAHLRTTAAVPDGRPPDACVGAAWDAQVVDNTRSRAPYTLPSQGTYRASLSGIALHAGLAYARGAYTRRSAAPFAIIDTVLTVFERVCTAEPAVRLPRLALNWSADNRPTDGDESDGEIGTSFHRAGGTGSNIFILGREDVDTDELDDHVIAHEVGHYLEQWLYRSDSGGGGHVDRDVLDPAVAFAEGWGNALSAIALDDPWYVDTKGEGQEGGFDTDISRAPRGDDRGIYSENSAQYLLWQLHARRGAFDRIHDVLRRGQRETPALTTALSFAAYYHAAHGPLAEDLRTLWSADLDTPYDALCAGPCTGVGDAADPFDVDDDVGAHYGDVAPRHYPDVDGVLWPRGFWTLHAPLVPGRNAPGEHEQTRFGNYDDFENKWGNNRYYRYRAARTGDAQISVGSPAGATCSEDVLDLYVYRAGVALADDESTSGCPVVRFPVRAGETYLVHVQGLGREVPSWVTTLTENKGGGRLRARLVRADDQPLVPGKPARVRLTVRAPRGADGVAPVVRARLRGLDGVGVPPSAAEWRAIAKVHEWTVVVPETQAGLVVADVAVAGGPRTTVALTLVAPGRTVLRRPVGVLVGGVVELP